MTTKVAVFLGSADSFNIRQTTAAMGETLGSAVSLDLVVTGGVSDNAIRRNYDIFDGSAPETRTGELRTLDAYLSSRAPDCIFNLTQPPIHGTMIALEARRHRVPFVYRYSGDRFNVHRLAETSTQWAKWYGLNNIVGRLPVELADNHIVLGPMARGRLLDRNVAEQDIVTLPTPIRTGQFTERGPAASVDIPSDRDIVLFVGRRSRLKGLETLESAIPRILDRRSDLQFVFVGRGRQLSLPREAMDHATVIGPVDPSEMPSYYRLADVLVHPSLTESFGRVLVESLLCGTPVVARDAGELPAVTSNLFATESELVDLVADYESLSLEDGERFTPERLRPDYIEFFTKW